MGSAINSEEESTTEFHRRIRARVHFLDSSLGPSLDPSLGPAQTDSKTQSHVRTPPARALFSSTPEPPAGADNRRHTRKESSLSPLPSRTQRPSNLAPISLQASL
jgi:hypothetical protein